MRHVNDNCYKQHYTMVTVIKSIVSSSTNNTILRIKSLSKTYTNKYVVVTNHCLNQYHSSIRNKNRCSRAFTQLFHYINYCYKEPYTSDHYSKPVVQGSKTRASITQTILSDTLINK